jgi:VanZ family protein
MCPLCSVAKPFPRLFVCDSTCFRFSFRVLKSKTYTVFLRYWLPVICWMMVIFAASADTHSYQHSSTLFEPLVRWLFPQMPEAQVEELHHAFRKCGHLSEYAVLALLLWRAIHRPTHSEPRRPWRWDEAGLALALVFLYAATDEFHQIFVPTRSPLITDVMIDTSGGAIALTLWWLLRRNLRFQKVNG